MRRAWAWFFAPPSEPITVGKIVSWWEWRRIPFNLVIGSYALVSLVAFSWAIQTSGRLQPGEDAVEPIGLLTAPFGVNVLYTLGWLVEVPARRAFRSLTPSFGPSLLKLGVALGVLLISAPAVFWIGIRLLQLARLIR